MKECVGWAKRPRAPAWEARYRAAPGGLAPLLALSDTAALISDGLRGWIAK